jgi:CDP-diacylglycerol---serine O-phosphatidyltransferase
MKLLRLISIADIFTCINGLLGLFSILATVSGWYFFAINLILLGVLADGLDGVFARRFSKRWYLGDYLDIMCDTVTFCVAPAVLMYKLYFNPADIPTDLSSFWAILQDMNKAPVLIPVACGALLVAGVLRLARFCYQSPFMKGDHFIGVPTPSAASTLTLLMLLDLDLGDGKPGTLYPVTVSILALALAFLMISDIKIIKMKGKLEWFAGGLVIMAIVLSEYPEVVAMVLLASVVYIVGGPLAIRRIEKKGQGLAAKGAHPKKLKKYHKEKPKDDSEE